MMKLTTAFIYSYSEGTEKERRKHIYAARNNSASATEFVYEIHMFSKAEMLGFVWDILHDDDVESHGVILTCPGAFGPWSGNPIAIPVLPDRQTFINAYRSTDITCITAILEYHYETMMLTYRLLDSTLSIILPSDMQADIDEIEKNVISDRIDHNPQ